MSAQFSRLKRSPAQVLYLDFDGVLHYDAVLRHPKRGIFIDASVAPGRRLFEWTELLVDALKPFPQLTIVLSTSWVRVLGYSRARSYLPPEISSRVVGATYHRRHHKADSIRESGIFIPERGVEVMRDVERRQPQQWVAVDDSPEGWPTEHLDRVVLCEPTTGLGNADTRARLDLVLNHYFGSASIFSRGSPSLPVPRKHPAMRSPNADETRLLREALETATQLHAAGVLSDQDRHAVFKICDQPSGTDSETALPLETALTTVAQKGLEASGFEVVKATALGVWHEGRVPSERVFQGPFFVEAALLVERLAFYAIVPQPRKKALLSLVSPLLPAAGSASRTAFNTEFKRYLPELQPLQTRHLRLG